MLIKCPECELQASDKATACPHCGYPLRPTLIVHKPRKLNKRKRLPNGFGQISEIKNRNLRKPFRAMVTIGKDDKGRPICKLLKPSSYFSTYNEAYTALLEYHKNPYDLDNTITMKELYDKWSKEYFESDVSDATIRSITSTWAYCSEIYDMEVSELRIRHVKGCMNDGTVTIKGKERSTTPHLKQRIKTVISQILDYAVEYEIVKENCARSFKTPKDVVKKVAKVENEHIAFTEEEMNTLWSNAYTVKYVNVMLIQAYSGWRPQELGLIELANVDLTNWTFTGGMKTDAGEYRTVPIHSKIKGFVEEQYNDAVKLGSKFLFTYTDGRKKKDLRLTYARYKKIFAEIIEKLELNPDHKPHDPRKTFVTAAKKYKVDEYAIKRMVGHVIDDITEKIYTEREMSWYVEEIEKIK